MCLGQLKTPKLDDVAFPYLCHGQGIEEVVANSTNRFDCFQNDRIYWLEVDLKKVWVVDENLEGQSKAKHKRQSCPIDSVVVGNHRLFCIEWEKLSLPCHREIFTNRAVRQDWVIWIKTPEDIFEDTGPTEGVLVNTVFNGLTSFQVLARPDSVFFFWLSWVVNVHPPTHRWISCHYRDGGGRPLLRILILTSISTPISTSVKNFNYDSWQKSASCQFNQITVLILFLDF